MVLLQDCRPPSRTHYWGVLFAKCACVQIRLGLEQFARSVLKKTNQNSLTTSGFAF